MSHKNFSTVIGAIFLVIAVLHLLRLLLRWDVSIGGWDVPMWLSGVAIIVSAYLGYQGIRLGKK